MTNLDRLREWSEAGKADDPAYTAGSDAFASDVLALMRERDQLEADMQRFRSSLESIARAWPCGDIYHMRMVAAETIGLRISIDRQSP